MRQKCNEMFLFWGAPFVLSKAKPGRAIPKTMKWMYKTHSHLGPELISMGQRTGVMSFLHLPIDWNSQFSRGQSQTLPSGPGQMPCYEARFQWPAPSQVLRNDKEYTVKSLIQDPKFRNLSDSRPVLQLSLPNLLKPCVKSRMKM